MQLCGDHSSFENDNIKRIVRSGHCRHVWYNSLFSRLCFRQQVRQDSDQLTTDMIDCTILCRGHFDAVERNILPLIDWLDNATNLISWLFNWLVESLLDCSFLDVWSIVWLISWSFTGRGCLEHILASIWYRSDWSRDYLIDDRFTDNLIAEQISWSFDRTADFMIVYMATQVATTDWPIRSEVFKQTR